MKKQLILLLLLTISATSLYAHGLDYPERYKELQLPEYPNATTTDHGTSVKITVVGE